ALSKSDMFDFLIDIVPREEAHPHKRSGGGGGSAVQSSAGQQPVPQGAVPQQAGVHQPHQMAPQDYGMGQHMQEQDYRPPGMYAPPVQGDPGAYGQPQPGMFDPNVYAQ